MSGALFISRRFFFKALSMDNVIHDNYLGLTSAVGHIAIYWAIIERQLEYICNRSFRDYGGNTLKGHRKMPHSFTEKKKYLEAFLERPLFKDFKDEGIEILEKPFLCP
ncbi:MAG TPA: hypothetical protein VMT94_03585 [Burkholderiales bacterium]|nr:hypothetical protein [Burkholderiales bacterium]